jgi:tetratricopeptide (TPR) repeat protein
MSKLKIIIFLISVYSLSFLCDAVLAETSKETEHDLLFSDGTQTYVNFCTGYYLMLDRSWEEAIVFLGRALETNPNAERIHKYLATCYFQTKQKEEALSHIGKIAQLKPDDFGIHYTLGNIYASEGNEKEAILEYERANSTVMYDIDKMFVSDMLHRLANCYMNNKDLANTAKIYKKILDLELTDEPVKVHYKLGQVYVDTQKIEDAIEEFIKAKEFTPHSEPISFYLALCYEEIEDYDNAIAELKSFVEYDPQAWLMRVNLSNIYEKVKQYDKAELEIEKAFTFLEESVGKGSKSLREYITLSQIFQRNGNGEKAIETLKMAIYNVISENDEALCEVHFMLANIYYEMNNHKNVIDELEKVLKIDPDNHQANNFLGYFFVEKGVRLDKAISMIEKAVSIKPENGAYLDSLGWAYYKLAKEDDGEQILLALQKLIEASSYAEDPEIMCHIGDIYYSLGIWEKAQNQWEMALKLWSESMAEVPLHQKRQTDRELKTKTGIQYKLDKIQYLKMVENSENKQESGERVVSNHIH